MSAEPVPRSVPPSKPSKSPQPTRVEIKPPNFEIASIPIVGTAPLVSNRFSARIQQMIATSQEGGTPAKNRRKRDPKDFEALYEESKHVSTEGWLGWPCSAFRNAMIESCRMAGYPMTRGRMSIFVLADGFEEDGTALVKMTKGKPRRHQAWARNETGVVDIRSRAMFDPGWEMTVRVHYDGDQFTAADIGNLMLRAGVQNGIGDGRPNSSRSNGVGWGTWTLKGAKS